MSIKKITVLFWVCFSAVVLAGCAGKTEEAPTKGIKIGELAPGGKQVQPQILRTTNINVITYELPAENLKAMDDAWQILNARAIRYIDANSFAANGLRAGAGAFRTFDKITGLLNGVKAKKLHTTTLMMQTGAPESITISRLANRETITYTRKAGIFENIEAGPGIFELQVTVRQVSDEQGTTSIHMTPAISVSTEGLVSMLAEIVRSKAVRFYSAGFGMNMKAGDLILLAPYGYNPDENKGIGRFFTTKGPEPTVKVLLFVCTSTS